MFSFLGIPNKNKTCFLNLVCIQQFTDLTNLTEAITENLRKIAQLPECSDGDVECEFDLEEWSTIVNTLTKSVMEVVAAQVVAKSSAPNDSHK